MLHHIISNASPLSVFYLKPANRWAPPKPLKLLQSAMKKQPSVAIQHASGSQSSSSGACGVASQSAVVRDHAILTSLTNLAVEIVKFGRFPYPHVEKMAPPSRPKHKTLPFIEYAMRRDTAAPHF